MRSTWQRLLVHVPRLNGTARELPAASWAPRRAMAASPAAGARPLAYRDGEPVGWVSTPRAAALVRIDASKATPRHDVDVVILRHRARSAGRRSRPALIRAAVSTRPSRVPPRWKLRARGRNACATTSRTSAEPMFRRAGFRRSQTLRTCPRLDPRATMRCGARRAGMTRSLPARRCRGLAIAPTGSPRLFPSPWNAQRRRAQRQGESRLPRRRLPQIGAGQRPCDLAGRQPRRQSPQPSDPSHGRGSASRAGHATVRKTPRDRAPIVHPPPQTAVSAAARCTARVNNGRRNLASSPSPRDGHRAANPRIFAAVSPLRPLRLWFISALWSYSIQCDRNRTGVHSPSRFSSSTVPPW